jgi:hypothetical protein
MLKTLETSGKIKDKHTHSYSANTTIVNFSNALMCIDGHHQLSDK